MYLHEMQEKHPLLEEPYRQWLRAHADEQYLGLCDHACSCALSQYLAKTYGVKFAVMPYDDTPYYENMETEEYGPLPAWAIPEATFFDRITKPNLPVTKRAYDEALRFTCDKN